MRTAIGNSFSVSLRVACAALVTVLICLNKYFNLMCQLKQTNYYSKQFQCALTLCKSTLSSHQRLFSHQIINIYVDLYQVLVELYSFSF